jgi:hypothetical protein
MVTDESPSRIVLDVDDSRRDFTSRSTDGTVSTYRVTTIDTLADGSIWCWAAQLTKTGRPYKSGMGLTMGGLDRMAEHYGQAVADVVTEALAEREIAETGGNTGQTVVPEIKAHISCLLDPKDNSWVIEASGSITGEQAAAITWRGSPEQVRLGAFVVVKDAEGVRIGRVSGATYIEPVFSAPFVVCSLTLR